LVIFPANRLEIFGWLPCAIKGLSEWREPWGFGAAFPATIGRETAGR